MDPRLLIIEALIVCGLGAGAWWTAKRVVRGGMSFRRANRPWVVHTSSAGNRVIIRLTKPGEDPILVAEVRAGDDDFEGSLFAAEAKAESMAMAMND